MEHLIHIHVCIETINELNEQFNKKHENKKENFKINICNKLLKAYTYLSVFLIIVNIYRYFIPGYTNIIFYNITFNIMWTKKICCFV